MEIPKAVAQRAIVNLSDVNGHTYTTEEFKKILEKSGMDIATFGRDMLGLSEYRSRQVLGGGDRAAITGRTAKLLYIADMLFSSIHTEQSTLKVA